MSRLGLPLESLLFIGSVFFYGTDPSRRFIFPVSLLRHLTFCLFVFQELDLFSLLTDFFLPSLGVPVVLPLRWQTRHPRGRRHGKHGTLKVPSSLSRPDP